MSHYSLEAYTSTAGSALRWLCDDLGLFASPAELGEEAARVPTRPGRTPRFVPALAGVRTPAWHPEATAALSGLTLATTRADIARAVLDGIAHSVCDLIDGVAATMGTPFTRLRVGGGVSSSEPLMRIQADLTGLPLERVADSANRQPARHRLPRRGRAGPVGLAGGGGGGPAARRGLRTRPRALRPRGPARGVAGDPRRAPGGTRATPLTGARPRPLPRRAAGATPPLFSVYAPRAHPPPVAGTPAAVPQDQELML